MTTVFAVSNKGHSIPKEWFVQATKACKWFGMAWVEKGEIIVDTGDQALDPEKIMSVQEQPDLKSNVVAFCFGASEPIPDNMQPFTIIADPKTKEPQLIAFLSGPFTAWTAPDSTAQTPTAAHFFAKKLLIPKCNILLADLGNMEKVIERLKMDHIHEEMIASAVKDEKENCVITLLSSTGSFVSYSHTDDMAEETWGWATHNFKHPEGGTAVQTSVPATDARSRVREGLLGRSAEDKKAAEDKAAASNTGNAPGVHSTESDDKAEDFSAPAIYGHPPKVVQEGTNGVKRTWYGTFAVGGVPKGQGWKDCPAVRIKPSKVQAFKASGGTEVSAEVFSGKKTTSDPAPKQVSIPILSAEEKKYSSEFLGRFDVNSLRIPSPEEMEEQEKKLPTLAEQTGRSIEEFLRQVSHPELREALVKDEKMAGYINLLIRDFAFAVIELIGENQELKAEVEALSEPTPLVDMATGTDGKRKSRFVD
jgi:hypothetical protein